MGPSRFGRSSRAALGSGNNSRRRVRRRIYIMRSGLLGRGEGFMAHRRWGNVLRVRHGVASRRGGLGRRLRCVYRNHRERTIMTKTFVLPPHNQAGAKCLPQKKKVIEAYALRSWRVLTSWRGNTARRTFSVKEQRAPGLTRHHRSPCYAWHASGYTRRGKL